jgi:hypothetical protein
VLALGLFHIVAQRVCFSPGMLLCARFLGAVMAGYIRWRSLAIPPCLIFAVLATQARA